MHHPKLLRSIFGRSAMIPAALLCVILSGCADQQPTAPILRPVARSYDAQFNKFFIAWSQTYSASPIQTQTFSLDARQDRQYADLYPNQSVLAFARANPGRLYIHGDEPDQYCITPSDYAVYFHDFVTAVRSADATARFSPAGLSEPNYYCCPPPADEPCKLRMHSTGYAEQFYNAYVQRYGAAPPVSEWRFHDFGVKFAVGDVDGWWSRIDADAAWAVAHGANMVLGTWGFTGWREPAPALQEHLKQAMGRLMNDKRINGAVFWSYEPWIDTAHPLVDASGVLTPEGQTYVNPLTDVPAELKIVGSADGYAKLRWTNTTSAWAAEAEFWVQPAGSSSFIYHNTERVAGPAATQTPVVVFNIGDSVKARVRYYNVFGQAAWSPFSNTVLLASTDSKSDPGAVSGKRPLFCFLQLCS